MEIVLENTSFCSSETVERKIVRRGKKSAVQKRKEKGSTGSALNTRKTYEA